MILMKPFQHLALTMFEVRLVLDLLKSLFSLSQAEFSFCYFQRKSPNECYVQYHI